MEIWKQQSKRSTSAIRYPLLSTSTIRYPLLKYLDYQIPSTQQAVKRRNESKRENAIFDGPVTQLNGYQILVTQLKGLIRYPLLS